MGIYIADQTIDFLLAMLLGAGLGLLYDLFRILRIALPHKKGAVTFEDILFWSLSAISVFFFLLGSVDGKVRFFLLAGMLLGSILYFQIISPPIIGLSRAIIGVIHAIMRFFARFFLRPIWRILYFIVSLVMRPLAFLGGKLKKLLRKLKLSLKKRRILLYNHLKGLRPFGRSEKTPEDTYSGNEEEQI